MPDSTGYLFQGAWGADTLDKFLKIQPNLTCGQASYCLQTKQPECLLYLSHHRRTI